MAATSQRAMASAPRSAPAPAPRSAPHLRGIVVAKATTSQGAPLKRAPSAYNLFYKEKYAEVRSELASRAGAAPSLSECNARVRAMWEELPSFNKVPYEFEAKKIKEQLAADRAAGVLPPASKPRARSPARASTGRGSTAFQVFTKAELPNFKNRFPDLKVSDIQKLISYKWSKLPQNEKDSWAVRSREASPSLAGRRTKTVKAASSYGSSNGYVATVNTLSATEEKSALKHFTAYELPNYQAQYPDLDKSDLERLISFKWSKLPAGDKAAWARNEQSATPAQRAAPVAPVSTQREEAGYASFLKAELPGMQAQYPDLDKADLEKLISYKWSKLSSRQKAASPGYTAAKKAAPAPSYSSNGYSSSSSPISSSKGEGFFPDTKFTPELPKTISAQTEPGFSAFAKAILPTKKAKYPDLDEADLERLIQFKWSKLPAAEKSAYASGRGASYSAPAPSYSAPAKFTPSYSAPASSAPSGDYNSFVKAELPSLQAQYPDLDKADLEKLLSYKWSKLSSKEKRRASPVYSAPKASAPAPSYSSSSSYSSPISSSKGEGFFPDTKFTPELPRTITAQTEPGFSAFYKAILPTKKSKYPDLDEADLERLIQFKWSKLPAAEKSAYASGRGASYSAPAPSYSAPSRSMPSYSAPASSAASGDYNSFVKAELPSLQAQYPDLDKADLEKLLSYKWSKLSSKEKRRASPVYSAPKASAPAPSYSSSSSYSSPISSSKGEGFFPDTKFTPELPRTITAQTEPGFSAFYKAILPTKKSKYPDLDEADLERLIQFKWSKLPAAEKSAYASGRGASYSAPAPSYSAPAKSTPSYSAPASSAPSGDYNSFVKAELPSLQAQYPDLDKADLEKLLSYKWSKLSSKEKRRASPVYSAPKASGPAPSYSSSSSYSSPISSSKGEGFFPDTKFTPQLPTTASVETDAGFAAFLKAELPSQKAKYPDLDEADLERLAEYKYGKLSAAERKAWASKGGSSSSYSAPSFSAPSYSSYSAPSYEEKRAPAPKPAARASSGLSGFEAFFEAELPAYQAQYPDLDRNDIRSLVEYKWGRLPQAEKDSYGGSSSSGSSSNGYTSYSAAATARDDGPDFWGSSNTTTAAVRDDGPDFWGSSSTSYGSDNTTEERGWSPVMVFGEDPAPEEEQSSGAGWSPFADVDMSLSPF